MGLTVLTMQGFNFNSRCGENINKNINMDKFIAKDDHDYINIAISLSKDPSLNEMYGKKLREKALLSPLFNTDQFTRDFEELIKEVYNKN